MKSVAAERGHALAATLPTRGAWIEIRSSKARPASAVTLPTRGAWPGEKTGVGTVKTKYALSPRRNTKGITVSEKKFAKLCGALNKQYPGLKEGEIRVITDAKYKSRVTADGYGGMVIP